MKTQDAAVAADQAEGELTAVFDRIFEPWNSSSTPGLGVGIARRGRVIYRRGFGLASAELGIGNQPNTRMRIGSTTKHFTCLSVMLLAEEGKIDIDADVRKILPELPDLGTTITARHLMQHTSGLRCHLELSMLACGMSGRLPDDAPVLQMFRSRSLNFQPGERMIYCNGGYVLLSLIVERLSGMDLGAFFEQRIFRPLGMRDTQLLRRDGQIVPRNATLHVPAPGGGYNRGEMIVPMSGDGGMISTVDDMLVWLRHMDAPVVGRAESWAAMKAPARYNNGIEGPYGFGLINGTYRGLATISHSGAVIGGAAEMLKVPAHGLDIVITTNMAGASPVELAKKVMDAALASELGPLPERPAAEDFEKFKGSYYEPGSGVVFVLETHNDLPVLDLAGMKIPLWKGKGDAIEISAASFDIRVEPPKEGGAAPLAAIDVVDCGTRRRFERLGAAPLVTAADVASVVGVYGSGEIPAEAELFWAKDQLFLGLQGRFGRAVYGLKPLAPDLWAAYLADRFIPYRIVVETAGATGGDTFHISSGRTRRLKFTRQQRTGASLLGEWLAD